MKSWLLQTSANIYLLLVRKNIMIKLSELLKLIYVRELIELYFSLNTIKKNISHVKWSNNQKGYWRKFH